MVRGSFVALVALFSVVSAARGDELKLKDGSTVVGTIVGFEEHSFKVKTSYGFAEVQKDQVVSIVISAVPKKKEPEKKADPSADEAVAPEPAAPKTPKPPTAKPVSAPASNSSNSPSVAAPSSSNSPQPSPTTANKPAANSAAPSPAAVNSASVIAPAAAPPPAPEAMREEVNGNSYVNDTYGFRMYKPPTWNVIEGARALLPGSITAMGTNDQTTYLLIGQQPAGKSLANDMDGTERRLQEIMENFRPLDEKHITISGIPAVERHFRGRVDQRDWSGVVVCIPRNARLYTIFGMTVADTDLVQIQENVIARSIASIQFTK
ncbi:MAG: hypothetical protein ABSB66_13920 [Candidatus Acidiferrales bacterium]|jgi:hypothetical protein